MSTQPLDPFTVEPVRITTHFTSNRRRNINQFVRGERIGKGQHGQVFLCTDEDNGRQVALKVVKRSNPRDRIKLLKRSHQQAIGNRPPLGSTEHSIRKEVAIMTKCIHANIVQLFEVIDDPQQDKIYLAMEYLSGGPVQWTDGMHRPILCMQKIRRIIRDVILGLEYLHHNGIIHRDIKPANLLWTADRAVVKIIDFGVAHFSSPRRHIKPQKDPDSFLDDPNLFPEEDLLKRAGTPSFLAPEVVWFSDDSIRKNSPTTSCDTLTSSPSTVRDGISMPLERPPITKAIDIWSLAVTFYCLLFGHTPFNVPSSANENIYHSEFVLYNQICTQDWAVDETMGVDGIYTGGRYPKDPTSEGFVVINILDRMLRKHPKDRITLSELKRNPWILRGIAKPKEWLRRTSPTILSANDVSSTYCWIKQASRKLLDLLPSSRHTFT